MANCVDYDVNPLYPFTQLNDVNELFRRVRIRNLDSMIYNPFDSNDDDIEQDLYALNSIQFDIPLSSYMFDPDTIPINNDCIKLRSFNIRSSTLHLEQFLDCQNSSFDILCLCETRLTEEHYKSVHIESFHSFHQGRNRLGGGVSLYVKSTLSPVLLPQLSFVTDSLETVAAQFSTSKGKRDVIISVYRPPKSNIADFMTNIEQLIRDVMEHTNQDVYIAGDINIDLLKTTEQESINFANLMYSYNLYCMINKPTRVTETSATLIDHIWTSNGKNVKSSYILVDDLTDHFSVEGYF